MKVVLLKDVKGTGKAGEIKDISDGYAMNFLLPKKLARPAAESDLNRKYKASHLEKKQSKKHEENKKIFKQVNNYTLNLTAKADEQNHIFGSVNAKTLQLELKARGFQIPAEAFDFEPIKTLGYHEVKLRLGDAGQATIKLVITRE